MIVFLRLGRIQVKGKIVRIVSRIRREGRQRFRDQERSDLHSWCI